jgi:hypothetical protein
MNTSINNNFDIGITTFSLRFDFLNDLVNKIRELEVNNRIFICVNGEKNAEFDNDYRRKVLDLCSKHDNVFPIFFVETRGLSKLWNTIIVHSYSENILVLNDDIDLRTRELFDSVDRHISSPEYTGLSKVNGTFSFYLVNKTYIDNLGYFDERLLGFGEEDGDITYRIIAKNNIHISEISAGGVTNIISHIRHEHVKPGMGKYSYFNRDFIFNKKYKCGNSTSGISGMFGIDCDQMIEDVKLYPYESFFRENKKDL